MTNFFEKFQDDLALKETSKGKGTGPISRILSGVNIFLWVYLLVNLFKNGFYIPVLLFIILGWGKFSHWMMIGLTIYFAIVGLTIYFAIVKYWPGLTLMLLSLIIGWFSVWFGMKNVKKNLFSNKALIDPFEGMNEMTIVYPFQIIFFVLALFSSGFLAAIFWIFFTILLLYEAMRYYWRLRSPWCGIHYPLMIRYAMIVGQFVGKKERLKKDFTIDDVLEKLIKSVYSSWSEEEVKSFVKTTYEKVNDEADKNTFIEHLVKQYSGFTREKAERLFTEFNKVLLDPKEYYLKAKMVTAEIIEKDYGKEEKMKYLFAVITDDAK